MKYFKSTLLIFFILLIFQSCSKNEYNSSRDFYVDVNVLGNTYNKTDGFVLNGFAVENCDNNNLEMDLSLMADIETSQIDVIFYIAHFIDNINFELTPDVNSTVVGDKSAVDDCFNHFDVDVSLWLKGEGWLAFKNSPNNFSRIDNVTKVEEDQTKITYAIKGSFESTYEKSDMTEVSVTSNYLVPIYVLK